MAKLSLHVVEEEKNYESHSSGEQSSTMIKTTSHGKVSKREAARPKIEVFKGFQEDEEVIEPSSATSFQLRKKKLSVHR